MNRIQILGLQAMRLFRQQPLTCADLADKLCICPRYAEQVLQHLRQLGVLIHVRTEQRRKYFQVTTSALLPIALSEIEMRELELLFAGRNHLLQSVFYKLVQLLTIK